MHARAWLRSWPPTFTAFLCLAVISAAALGGLAWELLRQDAAAEAHYETERLNQIAGRAVERIGRSLSDLGARLASDEHGSPIDHVLFVEIDARGLHPIAPGTLLYVPADTIDATPIAAGETAAERLEFRAKDHPRAAAAFARLSTAGDPGTRAAALASWARLDRARGNVDAAAHRYGELETLGGEPVEGWPAAYVARIGLASLDEAAHRDVDLRREARALADDLRLGRWPVDKSTYDYFLNLAASWLRERPPADANATACADAADWLWTHARNAPSQSITLVRTGTTSVLVSWRTTSSGEIAVIAGPDYLGSLGAASIGAGARWTMTDLSDGRTIAGDPSASTGAIAVEASAAGLPLGLRVASAGGTPGMSTRRRLLAVVLAIVGLVLTAGWYFILRAAAREARAARVQSDFVSAVSHEFRSPLTSLSHVSEMLAQGRLADDGLRQRAYDVLARDTDRLRRLVEGLLDFGKFEAGAADVRLEPADVDELTRAVVSDFQARLNTDEHAVVLASQASGVRACVDREAIGRAIWNLLDNAVKYSPDSREVWVDVAHDPRGVRIDVRDRGLGIPAAEQAVIFGRFVRGAESKARRIRGTGLGLAMVRQIVLAHHGEISVRSTPGEGSTFTIVLPTVDGPALGAAGARGSHTVTSDMEVPG